MILKGIKKAQRGENKNKEIKNNICAEIASNKTGLMVSFWENCHALKGIMVCTVCTV